METSSRPVVLSSPTLMCQSGSMTSLRPRGGVSIASYPGSQVAFSAEMNRLAATGFGTTRGVRVYDVSSGVQQLEALANETFIAVTISPDGETVAVGTSRGVVEVINVATGQVIATLDYDDPASSTVREVAYSPDGTMLAAAGSRLGGGSVAVKVWRTSDHTLIHTLSPVERSFGALTFSPDSTVIVAAATAANLAREILFWDAADGQLLHSFEATSLVDDLAFSPDGDQIVYGQTGGAIVVISNPLSQVSGDLDGDGDVDLADLTQLLAQYGTTNGATYEDGDLDGDGDVDLGDLVALLSVYGTTSG